MSDVSPEVLVKLTELVKALGAAGAPHPPFLEYLKGGTDFFNSVAWPAAAVVCVLLFRQQLARFIGEADSFKIFGAEVSRKLKQSAEEAGAITGRSKAPTEGELIRARELEISLAAADMDTIRKQAEELSAEYERVRHTMLPGAERTRQMEIVVSKMRTLARAFFPLRHQFADSPSPGKRLMAIAALQVDPDYDMLEWLAARLAIEKPFVGYHAEVALLLAMRAPGAKAYLPAIEQAVGTVSRAKGTLANDSDRIQTLDEIEKELVKLKSPDDGPKKNR